MKNIKKNYEHFLGNQKVLVERARLSSCDDTHVTGHFLAIQRSSIYVLFDNQH